MATLDNKIGLVTGGGMGIGRAICLTFAREGASVVVADYNEEGGQETVRLIQEAGGKAVFACADVSNEEQVKAMVATAVDTYGGLDVACNNAAVSRGAGPVHTFSREDFDFTVNMSLTQAWLCMKYEIEAMLASGGGSLINISSNSSLKGHAFNTPYAAAKGGVNILTKSAAAEYGGQGIRINAVSPGVIRTPGVEKYFEEQPKIAEELKKRSVLNRLGEPQEIAEAVAFLGSERASFITGQLLSVDGGGSVI